MELNEISICKELGGILSQDSQDYVDSGSKKDEASVCPLCSDEVRMFFINFNEKIKMCQNTNCAYPFGYEAIEVTREENGIQITDLKSCGKSVTTNSTGSQLSYSVASELEKVCAAFGADTIPGLDLDQVKRSQLRKKTEEDKSKEELRKNVEKIREMTKNMNSKPEKKKNTIKNQKWLNNLSYLQGLSGINLVKPEEMKKMTIKNADSMLNLGELTINIDKGNASTDMICIQIAPIKQNVEPA